MLLGEEKRERGGGGGRRRSEKKERRKSNGTTLPKNKQTPARTQTTPIVSVLSIYVCSSVALVASENTKNQKR